MIGGGKVQPRSAWLQRHTVRVLARLPLERRCGREEQSALGGPAAPFPRAVVESAHMNKAYELTDQERAEVTAVREVQEGFGLEGEAKADPWLKEDTYGVRFEYQTDGPGYVGPPYLLQGAGAPENPPIAMVQGDGGLRAVDGW